MFSGIYFPSSPVKLNTDTSLSKSVGAVQKSLSYAVGSLLSLGLMFVVFTSLGAAFVSGCPFRSPFSGVIRFIFRTLRTLSKQIPCGCLSSKRFRWLWFGTPVILWIASEMAAYATSDSGPLLMLFLFIASVPIAYSAQQEALHKPQKYKSLAWRYGCSFPSHCQ